METTNYIHEDTHEALNIVTMCNTEVNWYRLVLFCLSGKVSKALLNVLYQLKLGQWESYQMTQGMKVHSLLKKWQINNKTCWNKRVIFKPSARVELALGHCYLLYV